MTEYIVLSLCVCMCVCVCVCVCDRSYILCVFLPFSSSKHQMLITLTLDTYGDIHSRYVTYFDSINTAGRYYQNHLCHQPIPVSMRVFVCLLSAFALCQGNHLTTTYRLQFTMATGHYCRQVLTSTATHQINVCLTEELCGYEICAYITLT